MATIFNPYTERFLYEEAFDRFPMAKNDMGCGPIVHTLVGLPADAFGVYDPNVAESLDIRTNALQKTDAGLYNYVIEGCLNFPSDGRKICGQSNDLQMELMDPCKNTMPGT